MNRKPDESYGIVRQTAVSRLLTIHRPISEVRPCQEPPSERDRRRRKERPRSESSRPRRRQSWRDSEVIWSRHMNNVTMSWWLCHELIWAQSDDIVMLWCLEATDPSSRCQHLIVADAVADIWWFICHCFSEAWQVWPAGSYHPWSSQLVQNWSAVSSAQLSTDRLTKAGAPLVWPMSMGEMSQVRSAKTSKRRPWFEQHLRKINLDYF